MGDETSANALAAVETARTKLCEAITALRRAEQRAFDNDDMGLAGTTDYFAIKTATVIDELDNALKARV